MVNNKPSLLYSLPPRGKEENKNLAFLSHWERKFKGEGKLTMDKNLAIPFSLGGKARIGGLGTRQRGLKLLYLITLKNYVII